ncbi:DUF6716 putative glycosyltransferase [Streptomyces hydrogenans]|uniref:Uncharacterized protein n=1 Tax=Streptomyces hydrogenans TaxID=1873719 RepID=A0ABQ3P228_9ACTN|nr:DUF6716 putative glycosyltransferase [Streptomyces hydrogenans]GHE27065.1 hypothetical protein GCM10018784_76440 [Streptomyces hydrogenans]GHI19074.1 hypothetical protein Shyd_04450 [Streptomyces hydrogenans]
MPASSSEAVRIAVLADSDTRWKWGALTARRITAADAGTPGSGDGPQGPAGSADPVRPAEPAGFVLRGRATPTARQLAETGASTAAPREVTGAEFLREVRDAEMRGERYDVIVLALVGGTVRAVLQGLADLGLDRRPVVVTGYVGVVYEKLADGLLLRHGADVVLANSRHDADRFRAVYEGVGAGAGSVVEAALPFLGGAPYRPEEGRDTLVFAAQPSVPVTRAERAYVLERLVRHARLHPGREVLLKLRSKPGEHTTHLEEHPYQRLVRDLDPPANFRLVYGHMGEVLDRTDLLVTVSSTAALEALHRRIPTAILTDCGVREVNGNHHFIGSGLLTSFDRLDRGETPEPDEEWLSRQGVASDGGYDSAFDAARARVAELLALPELPPISPYYTAETAPGYLPGILARHRLDVTAPPVRDSGLRRIVREAARGAYRHGVQRVAPVVRRLGEL